MITTFRCEGFKSKEECDEYWNIPPICDENTPPGTTCRDEGDPDDCEEGFIDKGNGCEPIEEEEEKPPIECPYYGYVNTGDKCVPIEEEGTDGEGIPFVNELNRRSKYRRMTYQLYSFLYGLTKVTWLLIDYILPYQNVSSSF
jgi:hypothetical protein